MRKNNYSDGYSVIARFGTVLLVFILASIQSFGQPPRNGDKPAFDGLINEVIRKVGSYNNLSELPRRLPPYYFEPFRNRAFFDWIRQGFADHTPGGDPEQREKLFYALDIAAVVTADDNFYPLRQQADEAVHQVIQQIRSDSGDGRLEVYRLYNEGTIIRKKGDGCVGIDIVLTEQQEALAPQLADLLDFLLVTHEHSDHYQPHGKLVREMERKGKPVILVKDDANIPLAGQLGKGRIKGIEWLSFRGAHINSNFSGFVKISIGKWSILHSGDNTAWMEFADTQHAKGIDIFLFKPESIYLEGGIMKGGIQDALVESLDRISPKLIIPHHALELGHKLGAYGHDMDIRLKRQMPEATTLQQLHWGEWLYLE